MKNYELFIGIDISKSWIDTALTKNGEKSEMIHRQFDNNEKGFKKMIGWIKKYEKEKGFRGDWIFCMEHTGVYTLGLCVFLEQSALDYSMESALRIKKSLGIRRGKSDKADAMDIAEYAYLHSKKLKVNNLHSIELMQLKNLLSFRERLVKQKVMLQSSSKEFGEVMPDQFKVDSILEESKEMIKLLKTKIKATEKAMLAIIENNKKLSELYELITSVKSIGLIIGTYMIVHTNAFQAFKNARQFACYIAVAPFGRSSGSSLKEEPKVTKMGYKKIKALFSNACCCAIQHDKQLKAYFERKLKEGKDEGCIYNAIKNKLIARIFAVVKRGTPFVELAY